MADINGSLPIKSLVDGADERVQVKIVDSTNPDTQQSTVDTSGNLHVKIFGNNPVSSPVTVRVSEQGHVAINGIYDVANNTDPSQIGLVGHVRAATPADSDQTVRITSGNPADDLDNDNIFGLDTNSFLFGYDSANTQWDRITTTSGSLNVHVTSPLPLDVQLDGVYNGVSNTDPDSTGAIFHTRAAAPDNTNQAFRSTGVQGTADNTVWALDIALHDEAGDAFTPTNPLPIAEYSPGDLVHDYQTTADVAKDASTNHDYTVTALSTLFLEQVFASSAGLMKLVVQVETGVATGTFTDYIVCFNSIANPIIDIQLSKPLEVAAGVRVRLVLTNLDKQTDLYSFINGYEVA